MLMVWILPMLIAAHAFSSRPRSPLSLPTHNFVVDNLTPIHNVQNAEDQSHDGIDKEIREWITDEVSIVLNIVIFQCH